MTVDELINKLTALNIDHQEVKVLVQAENSAGMPINMPQPLTRLDFGIGGYTLVLRGSEQRG